MDIYAEELIDNYEHPHNKGKLEHPNAEFHGHNPVCGDDITVYLDIIDGVVKDVKFDGDGCSISIASASMLTDAIKGKNIDEIGKMGFEDLKKIIGIDPGPARLHCATLSLKALKGAAFIYEHKPMDSETKKL
ncbi:SUF system FeS assembly protein, NifU family [mine drainage metagenome]|uniref:SUF system FeS assembly protein, NifU family n=1 Tax=mine drainage metagenome TaxID=410659 RepID=T0ZJU8_9ZZZZ